MKKINKKITLCVDNRKCSANILVYTKCEQRR
nr:MAG TPA: NOTCH protein [Caudoviricetes sp.]